MIIINNLVLDETRIVNKNGDILGDQYLSAFIPQ